jgi:hypothetical protein
VEPEETSSAKQRLGKHVSATTSNNGNMVGNGVFVGSALGLYNDDLRPAQMIPCGGGVQYLHRTLASRRRRRKGNPVPGGITGPPCSRGIQIRGPGTPGWGNLESETVKCGLQSRGTRT